MSTLTKTQTAALAAIRDAGDAGLIRIGEVMGFRDFRSGMATGITVRKQTVDALTKAGLVTLDVKTREGVKTYTVKAVRETGATRLLVLPVNPTHGDCDGPCCLTAG